MKKTEIDDIKNLLKKDDTSCIRKCCFPKVFKSEASIQIELERIEKKMQEITEEPVFSSGHAFVCFDSLLSAYKCLNAFKESTWDSVTLKLRSMVDSWRHGRKLARKQTSTFGKFQDEDLETEMVNMEKVHILVDQMIEPFDIMWSNIGGDRGLFICRRIMCNILILGVLIFLTIPTV
jgi:hypothetical protein